MMFQTCGFNPCRDCRFPTRYNTETSAVLAGNRQPTRTILTPDETLPAFTGHLYR
ncbi:hypothetical protein KFZ76_10950 [Methylovulum psychrotolerans]|uniref:hypothetical protein n=1 Tax=Methylovulum psychrotolerans TaxID=1704499 RepID=UPI001BFF43C1|nr:hypothetical protein [Methylovulum psychrotolerans]MBT9098220.1 hypothetical protein [Methylovulum psychrotolerans]